MNVPISTNACHDSEHGALAHYNFWRCACAPSEHRTFFLIRAHVHRIAATRPAAMVRIAVRLAEADPESPIVERVLRAL